MKSDKERFCLETTVKVEASGVKSLFSREELGRPFDVEVRLLRLLLNVVESSCGES